MWHRLAISEILMHFISHRIHCLVVSYDFKGHGSLERLFNGTDKSNLTALFSGHQNKIDFISPAAEKVSFHLSSKQISERFKKCKF
jgi:hypothetical protein